MLPEFYLITPVSRQENMAALQNSVFQAFEGQPATYTWVLLHFDDEPAPKPPIKDSNIKILRAARVPGFHDIMTLFNTAIRHCDRPSWIWQVQDDNLVPRWAIREWLKAIAAHPDKRVMVCSHDRGDNATRHGASPLRAEPANMRVGHVSLEQYLIHSSLHEKYLYQNSACGDGLIMEALYHDYGNEFAFFPDFVVPFNALEPGRWGDRLSRFMAGDGGWVR